jgi:transglutaminase-like putative cysteine protease
MKLHEPMDFVSYASKLWWVMVAGGAARFSVERSGSEALAGWLFWTLVFAVCWAVRVSLSRGENVAAKLEKTGNVVAMLGLLLFLLRLNADGIIPALLALLMATQAAMFVTAAKRLHMLLIIGAAFGNLLFAAAESRSALFLLCAAWFTLTVLSVLSFDVRREREALLVTQPIGASRVSSGHGAFTLIVILIAVPFYLFVPKPAGLMLGGMQAKTAHDYRDDDQFGDERPSGGTNNSVEQEPTPQSPISGESNIDSDSSSNETDSSEGAADEFDVSKIQRDRRFANNIVMYVKSSQSVNLRGKIYDRFAGSRWCRDAHDVERHELVSGNWERRDARGSTLIQQSVEIVSDIDNILVHAPGLSRLRFPGPVIREYDDGVFEVPQAIRADTTYSLESRIDVFDGRYVDVLPRRRLVTGYLTIPDEIPDRVRDLAKQVTARADSIADKAIALETHLREGYQYSFDTIQYQGYTPVDWFLFDGKRGHCEYFASALAVMLRAVNIPSRLVTGFSLGERNPVTGYYEVRALNGHAWVEAYIPERGWVMLEPTPFYPLPTPENRSQVAQELDRYLERLAEEQQTIDPDGIKTQVISLLRDAWVTTRHVLKHTTEKTRALGWWLPIILVAAAIVVIAAYLLWQLTLDVRSNRNARALLQPRNNSVGRDAVIAAAEALQIAASPRGFARESDETMQDYMARLHKFDAATPREFADSFDSACYSDDSPQLKNDVIEKMKMRIEESIAKDRHPRVSRTFQDWRAWLSSLVPGH